MRKEHPRVTLVICVVLCAVGLVMIFSEAMSFRGWVAGNRMLAAFVSLLFGTVLLTVELYFGIRRTSIASVVPQSPTMPPIPQSRNTYFQSGAPATPSAPPAAPAPPPPSAPVPAPVSEKVLNGDKSFMAKAPTTPSWAKAPRAEDAAVLAIGPPRS